VQAAAWGVAASLVALLGCHDDGSPDSAVATPSVDGGPIHFVRLDDAAWELGEAVRPLAVTAPMRALEPSLDWWSEHRRDQPTDGGIEGLDVRLSGHHVGLERQVEELTGFDGTPTMVGQRRAIAATSPEGAPTVVSIELAPDYTVMVLSYALSADELAGVAANLTDVSVDEWTAAGGQVVPCAPPSPACPPTTTN